MFISTRGDLVLVRGSEVIPLQLHGGLSVLSLKGLPGQFQPTPFVWGPSACSGPWSSWEAISC